MTDKTEMNKVQKEFTEFVDNNYNNRKDKYEHIYWFFWCEEEEEDFYEWLEEIIDDFCKEYKYEYDYVVEKINENFITKRI